MKKIGVLGACFNPPTLGHQSVLEQALPHFDEILLVPSLKHPFNKHSIPLQYRLEMIRLLILSIPSLPAQKKISLFNVEASLLSERQSPYIYTFDVLEKLEKYYYVLGEQVQMRFVMGPDNAQKTVWEKFYKYKEIEKRWPPFVVKEKVGVHSEQVRTLILQHKQDKTYLEDALKSYLPPFLVHYVLRRGLYVA